MNVTSLPTGGADVRVYKTTATGNDTGSTTSDDKIVVSFYMKTDGTVDSSSNTVESFYIKKKNVPINLD